jgi:hypothetical protein
LPDTSSTCLTESERSEATLCDGEVFEIRRDPDISKVRFDKRKILCRGSMKQEKLIEREMGCEEF